MVLVGPPISILTVGEGLRRSSPYDFTILLLSIKENIGFLKL